MNPPVLTYEPELLSKGAVALAFFVAHFLIFKTRIEARLTGVKSQTLFVLSVWDWRLGWWALGCRATYFAGVVFAFSALGHLHPAA